MSDDDAGEANDVDDDDDEVLLLLPPSSDFSSIFRRRFSEVFGGLRRSLVVFGGSRGSPEAPGGSPKAPRGPWRFSIFHFLVDFLDPQRPPYEQCEVKKITLKEGSMVNTDDLILTLAN